jgi:hypothetical protein
LTDTYADGPENGAPDRARPEERAPPGRRVAAGLIDAGLLLVALGFVLFTELAFASEGEQDFFTGVWLAVVAPFFFALYHAYGTGATPGQLELRIGLRHARTGELAGVARTLFRAYLGLVFLALVLPAVVDLLFLVGGRSLRDRITATRVVGIELEGRAPELAGETIPELVAIFEPASGTRNYLRRGWALLRARPRLVVGTVAALYVVLLAVAAILTFLVVDDAPNELTVVAFAFFATILFAGGVYWTYAAVVVGVEDLRVGGPDATVWATLVRASRRANALTAALLILVPLLVVGGYLLLPMILVGRVALIAPALVLEDRRVLGAFRRSWELTRGSTLRLFGLYVLSSLVLWATLLAALLPAGVAYAVDDVLGPVVATVIAAAALVVVLAWLGAAWALVYEDARRADPLEDVG